MGFASSWCFKVNNWVHFTCGPSAFQSSVFALVLGLSEFDYRCIKREFSTPCSSTVFLDIVPTGFQTRCLGVHLSCAGSRVWDAQLKPLALQGKDWCFCYRSWCRIPLLGGVCVPLARPSLGPPMSWYCPFNLCCGSSVHPVFMSLYWGNYSTYNHILIYWIRRKDEFRIFLCHHLALSYNLVSFDMYIWLWNHHQINITSMPILQGFPRTVL